MRTQSPLLALGIAVAGAGTAARAENVKAPAERASVSAWSLDTAHTRVGFSVSHLVFAEVEGQFRAFSGKVVLDEADPTRSAIEFTADVASIDTGVSERDEHLRSGDFFAAAEHPKIRFESRAIRRAGKGYEIEGDLTIRGVKKRVVLDATLSEAIDDLWGKRVRAAKITGEINRHDFGVSWNKALDKGGVMVGDKVAIEVKAELTK